MKTAGSFLRVFENSGTGGFLVQSGEMMCTTSNSAGCAPIADVTMEPNMPSHLGPKRWGGEQHMNWHPDNMVGVG